MKIKAYGKNTAAFLIQIMVYIIIALPFKVMEIIPGFTDIRPVMLLVPVYPVFFGVQGCLSLAAGNLIMDVVSDSLHWSCLPGFIANFLGPFIIYWYWTHISKTEFSLKSGKNLLKHIALIVFMAFVQTVIITPAVSLYGNVDVRLFATTVMLNTSLFPIALGIPLTILMQEELGFKAIFLNKSAGGA